MLFQTRKRVPVVQGRLMEKPDWNSCLACHVIMRNFDFMFGNFCIYENLEFQYRVRDSNTRFIGIGFEPFRRVWETCFCCSFRCHLSLKTNWNQVRNNGNCVTLVFFLRSRWNSHFWRCLVVLWHWKVLQRDSRSWVELDLFSLSRFALVIGSLSITQIVVRYAPSST